MDMSYLVYKRKTIYEHINEQEKSFAMNLAEDYKYFIGQAKTEREAALAISQLAEGRGFVALDTINRPLQPGDRVYRMVRGKAVAMAVIGNNPLVTGLNIIGAHLDSPRLDLKALPLYEKCGLALFDTHYYGGIKKYQWLALPLSLHGVIIKNDGSVVNVCIGEDISEPVFTITDLLPHLSKEQLEKKLIDAVPGESLNAICGSLTENQVDKENKVKLKILGILNQKYGIVEEDFISAELSLVPAAAPRDVGIDKSMIGGYGQDDRICAYAQLAAIIGLNQPARTAIALFADKEEIGSVGNTGMQSSFFAEFIADLIEKTTGNFNELMFKKAMSASWALSADVNAAMDPNFEDVMEKNNSAFLGCGPVITKYTGSGGKKSANDANAEYLALVRKIFNQNNVIWQTGELGKVDQGGGGTIAYMLAEHGMDVVDCGVALLGMHSPFEVSHKLDLYMTVKGYEAFYNA
ncbi:aminopeptidase [Desulfotruncus alcoholivorax]|uniref:aminopeptidase n=1 Tax=Desulfotruncus alcoholivorax TaxID=265477 RepID=UPI0004209549|nr:aminopeptidase [Desulfotruncus alcoholivorax]